MRAKIIASVLLLILILVSLVSGQASPENDDAQPNTEKELAQRLPIIWNGRFSALGPEELAAHLRQIENEAPEEYATDDHDWGDEKPIVTCKDWLESGGHDQQTHWWACREAHFNNAFGPCRYFDRAQTSATSQFGQFSMADLKLNEIPESIWCALGEDGADTKLTTTITDVFEDVEMREVSPTLMSFQYGLEASGRACGVILTYVGRADFNGDGAEDLLVRWVYSSTGSGFAFGHAVLSRHRQDKTYTWTTNCEGAH